MLKKLMVLAFVLVLTGCPNPQILQGSGQSADTPSGYTIQCIKNPKLENCNE